MVALLRRQGRAGPLGPDGRDGTAAPGEGRGSGPRDCSGVVDTPMQEAIRDVDIAQFPAVERFRDLHEDGELVEPEVAAMGIWAVLADQSVTTGSVTDLRDR